MCSMIHCKCCDKVANPVRLVISNDAYSLGKAVMVDFSRLSSILRVCCSMLVEHHSAQHLIHLLAKAVGCRVVLSSTSPQPQCYHPLPAVIWHQGWHMMHQFPGIGSWKCHKISCMPLSSLLSLLCHTGPGTPCSMPSQPSPMLAFTRICMLLQSLVKTYSGSLVYPEMTLISSWFLVMVYPVNACTFLGSGLTPCLEIISPKSKNGMQVYLKRQLLVEVSSLPACISEGPRLKLHYGFCLAHWNLQLDVISIAGNIGHTTK